MTTDINGSATATETCPNCGGHVRVADAFCGRCGAPLEAAHALPDEAKAEPPIAAAAPPRKPGWQPVAIALVIALGVAGIAIGVLDTFKAGSEHAARQRDVRELRAELRVASRRLGVLETENATLTKKVGATQKSLTSSKAGVAPLATRVLRSVFTVETPDALGTGWAAWTAGGSTYLITANHVAQDAISSGTDHVTVKQKAQSWRGTVTTTDSVNDLAVIRVPGAIAPPLWQTPDDSISPAPGDQLLLVGSPYGLEGTVTTGVVSRVAYDEIQTDAAANPGNSGGPGVDAKGRVVGVLLSGGGENLNFLVPIQRACVTIRHCL
jgi:putative serine protease PepD